MSLTLQFAEHTQSTLSNWECQEPMPLTYDMYNFVTREECIWASAEITLRLMSDEITLVSASVSVTGICHV